MDDEMISSDKTACTIEVVSANLDFVRALREAPTPLAGGRLSPGTPSRTTGTSPDVAGRITAQLDTACVDMIGHLVAAWIWQAFHLTKAKPGTELTLILRQIRLSVAFEGETEAEAARLLSAVLRQAGLDGCSPV
jgi:hypothetical protein